MKTYVGIDLGTTNSAVCSYNGEDLRIWKSPEQNDVTPSVIYLDRRGNKHIGKRAYDSAPHSPDNAAMLFKRFMGTSTPVTMPAVNLTMTPEECSAEVLKVLFGYLPEELRNDPETGTVITVPAAFNQMQKDATMHAAELAGVGKVALMQEPVAAVMSVMRTRKTDGAFVIYDLGGGTLDVAIAESLAGRVTLLAHGGIAMCGGRDWDRLLVDNVVKPWLFENFDLPEDLSANPTYKTLMRLSAWAAERAKIELSSREEAVINLSETETRIRDQAGSEIYLDIALDRSALDRLIDSQIVQSVEAARETLGQAGLSAHDMERIVFVGGPTHYRPLRDKVSFELGIPASTEVNPMTAVAEGAALFAESIDWSSKSRGRKSNRGKLSSAGKLDVSFNYLARTPEPRAKILVQFSGMVIAGAEFQIDSLETGWTSGRIPLANGASIDVTLAKDGENAFKVFVFDAAGGPVTLEQDKILITRTTATVDGIPASYSIGLETLEKLGGRTVLRWLVRAGGRLPVKGSCKLKSTESLKAGATGSLNFKLWEGDIEDPIHDNRFIGTMKIAGSDFDDGVIPAGADLVCDFEVLDSGNIVLEISIPSIGGTFNSTQAGHNFYSRQAGLIDFSTAAVRMSEEGDATLKRLNEINEVVDHPKLDQARDKLEQAVNLDPEEPDHEKVLEADQNLWSARRLIAQVRQEHLKDIRRIELDGIANVFEAHVREHARPSEERSFDNLLRTAQREIEHNGKGFETYMDELRSKCFEILWRQDWFVVEKFRHMASHPYHFSDLKQFNALVSEGTASIGADDMGRLRQVVGQLAQIQVYAGSDSEMFDAVNIILG
ncbi:Hsp70 family protein [Thiocapsa sp. UBA6158]|jgi:molecular chaperone DnaK|uniref:Hsp70 family protein n=1 Tax=Thiocapsa sp. UBA6158 TaxID=1947692 RepID=UPI0025E68FCD|nr:Hsp70 family protein [Thiocapsa sp. UBA6158]